MQVQLQDAVGKGAPNREDDVRALQAALKEAARLTLDARLDPGPIDGASGNGTEGAIMRMQRRISIFRPDGRADPGGYTVRRLNALLGIDKVKITHPFTRSSTSPFLGPGGGMRMFGWPRSGGRAHAGIDLYMPDFEPVLALADGVVIREAYDFYWKTQAVEIDHGAFVARYGEIAPDVPPMVRLGDRITRGQPVGRVGILKKDGRTRYTGVPSMMLHLEMYDKTSNGSLTQNSRQNSARALNNRSYLRRKDLIDPTGFIHRAALPT